MRTWCPAMINVRVTSKSSGIPGHALRVRQSAVITDDRSSSKAPWPKFCKIVKSSFIHTHHLSHLLPFPLIVEIVRSRLFPSGDPSQQDHQVGDDTNEGRENWKVLQLKCACRPITVSGRVVGESTL